MIQFAGAGQPPGSCKLWIERGGRAVPVCYIFGSGEYGVQWPRMGQGDLIIAADGGYAQLEVRGVIPHLLVGDFDSLGYVPAHPHIVRHPAAKDDTDTALAIREGWARGLREFHIYGGMGGRLDHTLANLQLLVGLAQQGGAGFLVGEQAVATALTAGALRFPAGYQGTLSVFAAGGPAEGVTLTGLRYPLREGRLTGGVPLGVSNEFLGAPAGITVEEGTVLALWQPQPELPLPEHHPKGM
ncbi:MAG TPA: thiamine diphosphokinase [Candidatus Enterenecus merdae]|nr:thiamine diphosphokinase [Candidatus Enterenecus merdae]